MSLNTMTENPKKWIEQNVQNGYIPYYLEKDLSHRSKIGGSDYKAVLKQSGSIVTVTSLLCNKERPEKEFYKGLVKEVCNIINWSFFVIVGLSIHNPNVQKGAMIW